MFPLFFIENAVYFLCGDENVIISRFFRLALVIAQDPNPIKFLLHIVKYSTYNYQPANQPATTQIWEELRVKAPTLEEEILLFA